MKKPKICSVLYSILCLGIGLVFLPIAISYAQGDGGGGTPPSEDPPTEDPGKKEKTNDCIADGDPTLECEPGATITMPEKPVETVCWGIKELCFDFDPTAIGEMKRTQKYKDDCKPEEVTLVKLTAIRTNWAISGPGVSASGTSGNKRVCIRSTDDKPLPPGEYTATQKVETENKCAETEFTIKKVIMKTEITSTLHDDRYIGINATGTNGPPEHDNAATFTVKTIPEILVSGPSGTNLFVFRLGADSHCKIVDADNPEGTEKTINVTSSTATITVVEKNKACGTYKHEILTVTPPHPACLISTNFTVVSVNVMLDISEEKEEIPGCKLKYNNDNDNVATEPSQPDRLETQVTGEDDLKKMHIEINPKDIPGNEKVVFAGDLANLWEGRTKIGPAKQEYTIAELVALQNVEGPGLFIEGHDISYAQSNNITAKHFNSDAIDKAVYTVQAAILKEIGFSGPENYTLKSDSATTSYSSPHWLDYDEDGIADQNGYNGDRNYPVCYKRNGVPSVCAKIIASFPDGTPVTVTGFSNVPGVDIRYDGIISGNEINVPITTSVGKFVDVISLYNLHYEIEWVVRVFDPNEECLANLGTSRHVLYLTMDEPETTAKTLMCESLFNFGCDAAKGLKDDPVAVANAIYNAKFVPNKHPGPGLRPVNPGTADPHPNRVLHYYKEGNNGVANTSGLLNSGDGQCGAWARMLTDVFRAQGIKNVEVIGLYPPPGFEDHLRNELSEIYPGAILQNSKRLFFVKVHYFGSSGFHYVDGLGVPGQATEDPKSIFEDHGIVLFDGKYYDPSYGSPVAGSILDYERQAFDFYGAEASFTSPGEFLPKAKFWIWRADDPNLQDTTPASIGY